MSHRYLLCFLITLLCACPVHLPAAQADTAPKAAAPDPRAQALLTQFLQALQIEDESKRIQACLPLLHKSLLTANGKDLTPEIRNYQFQKASKGAKWYLVPAKITRVRPRGQRSFGDAPADKGREDDYVIVKKEGAAAPSTAPVSIFFPDDGSGPKILYMGSL